MQSNGDNMSIGDKVIISAPIGGTAEALGGGKPARRNDSGGGFSNGAVTGAFVYLLNHAAYKWHPTRKEAAEATRTRTETTGNEANYLDYKVFAASNAVLNHPITGETECLEYNQGGSGIHEMQFYFDHLITFTNECLNHAGNSGLNKKWFCGSIIESHDEPNNLGIREIWHTPKLIFKKRGYTCVQPPVLPY
jgi:hypothetical protein